MTQRFFSAVRRFLIWSSGANQDVLARCPTDVNKYVGVGGAVVTTASLAVVSFMFASRSVLGAPWVLAVLGSFGWGAAIFNLDRWLVSSVRRQPTFFGNLVGLLPRLVLAIVLGLVISEPLVLQVFAPEIEQRIVETASLTNADNAERLAQDPRFVNLPKMHARADELQAIVDGTAASAAVLADPEVAALAEQLKVKDGELFTAQQAVICEVEGKCGSNKVGFGPAAREKFALRDQLARERGALAAALESKKQEVSARAAASSDNLRASAAKELEELRSDIAAREAERTQEAGALRTSTAEATGLLARIEALHHLGETSGALFLAHWLLRIFITLIDALAVIVKFLMSLLPASPYERLLQRTEDDSVELQELDIEDHHTLMRLRAEVPLHEARAQHQLEVDLADVTASKMVAAQGRLYDELLTLWEDSQRAEILADPNAFIVT